jgi:hypothetical protein
VYDQEDESDTFWDIVSRLDTKPTTRTPRAAPRRHATLAWSVATVIAVGTLLALLPYSTGLAFGTYCAALATTMRALDGQRPVDRTATSHLQRSRRR